MNCDARKFLFPIGIASICLSQNVHAQEDNYSKNNQFGVFADAVLMVRSGGDEAEITANLSGLLTHQDMDTTDLRHKFEYEPGYRVGIDFILDAKNYFEANYLWIAQWSGRKTVAEEGMLYFPFDDPSATTDYYQADIAQGHYTSNFYSTEANYWRSITPRNDNYFAFSAIVGVRYMNLHESLVTQFTKGTDVSDYRIHTKNRLVGDSLELICNGTQP